eukprot:TRINITY_DN1879_c0_g1_i1.p1 TRINITY_DN1879_c0_g1~~TRINITY_DN1879_c0_g1_i1.p1  ORF type:complete len:276 (-),score=63.56 TRINITY_DN1879_c0_g1_i1:534-1361(-)
MAGHYAISFQEDDSIIRKRLLSRTTVTRGDPPLKKLMKRFSSFIGDVSKDGAAAAGEGGGGTDVERSAKAFLLELQSFQLPLERTRTVVETNQREQENFRGLQLQLDLQIQEALLEIEAKKGELEEERVKRRQREEYETIREEIVRLRPRADTKAAIEELKADIDQLEKENAAAAAATEVRKKQFALLMNTIDALQGENESFPEAASAPRDGGAAAAPATSSLSLARALAESSLPQRAEVPPNEDPSASANPPDPLLLRAPPDLVKPTSEPMALG